MTHTSSQVAHVSENLAKRKAGRPRSTHLQGKALKEHVLNAAGMVYGEVGYHDCSVDKIAKAAGISRPLFYRLYDSKDQVLDILIQRTNKQLVDNTRDVTLALTDFFQILDASIDVYFRWCLENKHIVRSIYREINDLQSPAGKRYENFLYDMLNNNMARFAKVNVNTFRPELIMALTKAVEYAGNEIIQPEQDDPALIALHRDVVRRIVFASLASSEQSREVPRLETVLKPQEKES